MKYEKEYERDNGLLVQDAWTYAFSEIFGEKNPFSSINVYYIENGVTQIWHGVEAHEWFRTTIVERITLEKFEEILSKMNEIGSKYKTANTIEELKPLLFKCSRYWVILYTCATDERVSPEIKEKALVWRETDSFYDDLENKLKRLLVENYPVGDNQVVISFKDLDNIPSADELKERMKHYVYIPGEFSDTITLKEYASKHPEHQFMFDEIPADVSEIKGRSAFKGVVTGRVRVVTRKIHVPDVQEGEILVSTMTTPDFIEAMKKSAAFVTDEGGITCHAAIIAREMKKPCVIGTKIGSKVLKTGDMVEVDAGKGVVRKV